MWSLTAELALDIVGDLPVGAQVLVAEATAVTSAPDPFIQCRIATEDGTVVVTAGARMVYVPATAQETRPDSVVAPDVAGGGASLDAMLGLTRSHTEQGWQISVANPGRWVNAFGIMHGGVSAAVAEFAAAEAVRAHNPALSTAHMHTTFLRPVAADAAFATTARLLHIGRSSAVVEVLGHGGRGELCTASVVTARL